MGKLIERDDLGNWGVKGLPWNQLHIGCVISKEIHDKLYGCLWKLMEYESTGLAPQQVEKLQEKEVYPKDKLRIIDEAIEASAKAICVGCGYLDGYKCTYKGSNCGVSKPMLESVVKAVEQLKGGAVRE